MRGSPAASRCQRNDRPSRYPPWLAIAFCLLATDLRAAQESCEPPAASKLPGVTWKHLIERVAAGGLIESRSIPAPYVQKVMTQATDEWRSAHPNAALRIHRSVITGTSLSLDDLLPEISVDSVSPVVKPLLPAGRKTIRSLRLRFELNCSTVQPKVIITNALFARGVRFQNVVFEDDVELTNSTFEEEFVVIGGAFKRLSIFTGITPLIRAGFNNVAFGREAEFAFVRLPHKNVDLSFTDVQFPRDFNLSGAAINGVASFMSVKFGGQAFFNRLNHPDEASLPPPSGASPAGTVSFADVSLASRAYFDESRLAVLALCNPNAHQPVSFAQRVTFSGGEFGEACFKDVEFGGPSTFASRFAGTVDFRWAGFAEEANFIGADFENADALLFAGFRIEKQIKLQWEQIERPISKGRGTSHEEEVAYLTLLDNFRRTEDLASENGCRYAWRERFHQNWISWAIWGYGARPLRTFVCILLFFAGMVAVNSRLLKRTRSYQHDRRARWWNATVVAFETSSLSLPPLRFSSGYFWKLLLIVEWGLMKALQVVFIIACSNTSRVLKELVPRLWPG